MLTLNLEPPLRLAMELANWGRILFKNEIWDFGILKLANFYMRSSPVTLPKCDRKKKKEKNNAHSSLIKNKKIKQKLNK